MASVEAKCTMPSKDTIERIMEFAGGLKDVDPEVLREMLEIARLHRDVERHIENELAGWGLTARQVEILETLHHHPEGTLTPADLSVEVGLTRSAMTSALDSTEKMGYTVRDSHPSDRRMLVISLTPTGQDFIRKHLPERYRKACQIMSSISKTERKMLLRTFGKVLKFFERETKAKGT